MILLAITVDLMDVLLGLLILAGVAALVGLTLVLINLSMTLKTVNALATDLQPRVSEILSEIPTTVRRVDSILCDVNKISTAAGESFPPLVRSVAEAGETLTDTVAVLGDGAYSAANAVTNLFKRFEKGEKTFEINNQADISLIGQKAMKNTNLAQVAGAAIGTYRFVQKLKKAKKKADRKRKFGF